ncbi:MAG: aspartate--ammonia ligase [Clostridia bacterium]|nr:aspartate--ammonia ligase [Clostridia bacterium]
MIELDGARLREKETAYPYLRERLGLPAWFGNNLDALYDALTGENLNERYLIRLEWETTPFLARALRVFEDACGPRLTIQRAEKKECGNMAKSWIPAGYHATLGLYDTQAAIGQLKRIFEDTLAVAMNLKRVSAPLFVDPDTGLNDDLNGVERPVSFDIRETGARGAVVHSLAKWKRMALRDYGFPVGEGLYTDMNAIRRDEEMDNLHSIYVDQWDWEKVITASDRTLDYLKETVRVIVGAICLTNDALRARYPALNWMPDRNVSFVTTQELEDMYPTLTPKQREDAYTREHATACILQIGGKLRSGEKHDGRAPDYDDWTLNADIVFYNPLLNRAFEVSSMGIRVDPAAMDRQLREAGCDARRDLPFHRQLLAGELPLTIGGGIGQSRLCMLILGKAHIGEVQVSLWDEDTRRVASEAGVILL